jgi:hypothetical protein
MVPKTMLVIIVSSLLLLTIGPTPFHLTADLFPAITPPPPPGDEPPVPPGFTDPGSSDNKPSTGGDGLWQAILDSLESAWQGIAAWLDGAVDDLQRSIEEAISQFWQGLIDQFVQQATQMLQDLFNQTCGTALLLPAGAIAGVWLLSYHNGKQDHS